MIKVLVLCNSLETVKKITNKVVANLENTRVVGIATSLSEITNIVENFEPDLIITTSTKIFDWLNENLFLYTPGIIVISDTNIEKDFSYKNFQIIDYHLKFTDITEQIHNFIKENLYISKKSQTIKILSYIGFSFKLSGTNYLLDSILYANSYKGSYSFDTLYYDIFPHIAELNNTTTNVVKWAIERSIRYLYTNGDDEVFKRIEKYTGVTYPDRITSKFIINLIASKLNA